MTSWGVINSFARIAPSFKRGCKGQEFEFQREQLSFCQMVDTNLLHLIHVMKSSCSRLQETGASTYEPMDAG